MRRDLGILAFFYRGCLWELAWQGDRPERKSDIMEGLAWSMGGAGNGKGLGLGTGRGKVQKWPRGWKCWGWVGKGWTGPQQGQGRGSERLGMAGVILIGPACVKPDSLTFTVWLTDLSRGSKGCPCCCEDFWGLAVAAAPAMAGGDAAAVAAEVAAAAAAAGGSWGWVSGRGPGDAITL